MAKNKQPNLIACLRMLNMNLHQSNLQAQEQAVAAQYWLIINHFSQISLD